MPYAEPLNTAVRKARYGHRDWLLWRDRDGQSHIAPASESSIKTAMLARGTKGDFTLISGSSAVFYRMTWPLALNLFRQYRRGFLQ